MKKILCFLLIHLLFSCSSSLSAVETIPLRIECDGRSFKGYFHDNETTQALLDDLPLHLDMRELNGNEKYAYLDNNYKTDSERVGQIQEGDLMLYGDNCLVLFYEGFSTGFSYTRLGRVEGDLSMISGDQSVMVSIYKE